jgi:hypothetical protein
MPSRSGTAKLLSPRELPNIFETKGALDAVLCSLRFVLDGGSSIITADLLSFPFFSKGLLKSFIMKSLIL